MEAGSIRTLYENVYKEIIMARIPLTELSASLGCEPQLFANYYLDRLNEPIFQDYSLAEAGRIIDKYVKYIKAEAYKSILINYQHRTDDESEKIRALALMESLRNKPLMDVDEAKEYRRQKDDILSIEISDKFFETK